MCIKGLKIEINWQEKLLFVVKQPAEPHLTQDI